MKSTSSFRTQRHTPSPRFPKSFQSIYLFIHSLFASSSRTEATDLLILIMTCSLEAWVVDKWPMGQSELWCSVVPSKTFGLCCQICITYMSSNIPQRFTKWSSTLQFKHSNKVKCNFVALKYLSSIHLWLLYIRCKITPKASQSALLSPTFSLAESVG